MVVARTREATTKDGAPSRTSRKLFFALSLTLGRRSGREKHRQTNVCCENTARLVGGIGRIAVAAISPPIIGNPIYIPTDEVDRAVAKARLEATRMCATHHVGIGAVRIRIVWTRRRSGGSHDVPIVSIGPAAVVPVIASLVMIPN